MQGKYRAYLLYEKILPNQKFIRFRLKSISILINYGKSLLLKEFK